MKTRTSSPRRWTCDARAVELPLDRRRAEPAPAPPRRPSAGCASIGCTGRPTSRPNALERRRARRPARLARPPPRSPRSMNARRTAAERRVGGRARAPRPSRPRARPGAARLQQPRRGTAARARSRARTSSAARRRRAACDPGPAHRADPLEGGVDLANGQRRLAAGRAGPAAPPTPRRSGADATRPTGTPRRPPPPPAPASAGPPRSARLSPAVERVARNRCRRLHQVRQRLANKRFAISRHWGPCVS